ncbi:xylulokinase [Citricoccus sp. K5]|uniref:xylulokinase n=1 Tax=Citricoccus sp. K5 TaxID=2653135 RepID=UPI0012F0E2B4|nr:xylulokinase [Citricoccus sp. K5]VXB65402.1 Xylulose kinase [Citricoccus sp. K5]
MEPTTTSCYLGVDLGTSSVKVVAVDEEAAIVVSATRTYPLHSPESGWVEQDPLDWWRATAEAVREVVDEHPELRIAGIGLTGQMHGLVALDDAGEVVRPAILWNDNRTDAQVQEIVERVGGQDRLLALTNNPALAGFTAGKILWLQQCEPESFAQVASVLLPKDYLRYRMTGINATDVSDASGTGLFDVRNRRWSDEMFTLLGLPRGLMPTVFESSEVTGYLSSATAEELGLPAGIPVVAGGGDSVLQTTSMGITQEGAMGITIGTAGIVAQAAEHCPDNVGARVQVSCGNEPGRWHVMGVALTCGETLLWLTRALSTVKEDLKVADVVRLAESAEPGSQGLRFAPYLVGERCPYPDPGLRAAWFGLDLRHTAADMARAGIEGALLNVREIRDLFASLGLQADRVLTSGGAARFPLWKETLSNVLNTRIEFVRGGQGGAAYGAALLAGIGVGRWRDLDDALQAVGTEEYTDPNPGIAGLYDNVFREFKAMMAGLAAYRAACGQKEMTP